MKFIQQKDLMDCGSVCLAMIANHYGMPIIESKGESIARYRQLIVKQYKYISTALLMGNKMSLDKEKCGANPDLYDIQ